MRSELQTVLDALAEMPTGELPALLGELEVIRATALLRMFAPAMIQAHDGLLDVNAAAERLGVSSEYLYRHSSKLPFTRRMGRKLLFSEQGITAHIRQKNHSAVLTARQQQRILMLSGNL